VVTQKKFIEKHNGQDLFRSKPTSKQFPYSIRDFKVRRELYCSEDQQRKRKGYQKGAILLIVSSNGGNKKYITLLRSN